MPTIQEYLDAAQKPEILSSCQAAVKRAAYAILINPASLDGAKAWATRAVLNFSENRIPFYALRVIEGSLVEQQSLRDAVAASIASGQPLTLTDQQAGQLVDSWVTRFVAQNV